MVALRGKGKTRVETQTQRYRQRHKERHWRNRENHRYRQREVRQRERHNGGRKEVLGEDACGFCSCENTDLGGGPSRKEGVCLAFILGLCFSVESREFK